MERLLNAKVVDSGWLAVTLALSAWKQSANHRYLGYRPVPGKPLGCKQLFLILFTIGPLALLHRAVGKTRRGFRPFFNPTSIASAALTRCAQLMAKRVAFLGVRDVG